MMLPCIVSVRRKRVNVRGVRQAVRSCPLFIGVTEQQLDALLAIALREEYGKGQIIFHEEEQARGFFVPVQGKVKIYKLSPHGKERILRIAHPGRTFAEAAIFDVGLYPANAEALESTTLLFFPKSAVLELLNDNTQLAINIIAGVSRILRELMDHMESLTFRDVPARLARYLVHLSDGGKSRVQLPTSKAQLAANLGTVGETLSRTFRKLADDGLIVVHGRTIEILDGERLEDLAGRFKE
jgi:CRP/FNR family transcriptional regulator